MPTAVITQSQQAADCKPIINSHIKPNASAHMPSTSQHNPKQHAEGLIKSHEAATKAGTLHTHSHHTVCALLVAATAAC
jgi:hypothetical protein